MIRLFIFIAILINVSSFAQCKTYRLSTKGDTLNCTDFNNLKQGKWVVHIESLRGEPGYEQEGTYKSDKRDGFWRSYTLSGDLMSIENFKWGYKNGACYYYNVYGLQRQESWKAIDPENPYDTIDVPDLHTDAVYKRIVKVEASTVKHGTWTYYNPENGTVIKTEDYILNQMVDPSKKKAGVAISAADSATLTKTKTGEKAKPAEVLLYEKKNAGKKKIKVRDGATGGPN